MIKLLKKLRPIHWIMILTSIFLIVGQVFLDLKMPEYVEKITNIIAQNIDETNRSEKIREILVNGGFMMLCALGSLFLAFAVSFIMSRMAASFSVGLRDDLYMKIDSFSLEQIRNFSTESLITRTTNDVTQVQMYISMGAQLIIKAPILSVWAIIKIANKGFEWSMATAITILLLLLLVAFVMIIVVPKFRKIQTQTDDLTRATRETLTGVRVVRAYNAEEYQEQKFEDSNMKLTKINLFTGRAMAFMMPIMNLLMGGLTIAIYIIGAVLINNEADPLLSLQLFADMSAFSRYAMQVIMAFMMLVMIFFMLPRTIVSAKRINEVLASKSKIADGVGTKDENNTTGEIEFKNVSFKYPSADEYILKDINLKINKGEVVAFIGSTGSGKSTLINLIPRFYDATEGEVLIDGENIKDYKLEQLHNKIGYITQKAVLFKGTVRDNIAFGKTDKEKPTDEDIWKALEIAQGYDFVNNLPEKLDDEISQGGTNLSGGQKQRISIARAIARKPEIFIFDDSFSALDYKTDKELRTKLKENTKGVTSIIVAQRIGTIMHSDKIVVLDKGRIVGVGKHQELLKTSEVYKEIAMSQLSEEELA